MPSHWLPALLSDEVAEHDARQGGRFRATGLSQLAPAQAAASGALSADRRVMPHD